MVQAATKWKRIALKQFDAKWAKASAPTCARSARTISSITTTALRGPVGLGAGDHAGQRNLAFLKDRGREIWKVLVDAEKFAQEHVPTLEGPSLPESAEAIDLPACGRILDMYPDLPAQTAGDQVLQKCPAIFIIGIGWPLKDGYPHEMRAADYDDWVTETHAIDGQPTHGLNGDILVWNPVTKRRHELTSMGIRVTAETLKQQLRLAGQLTSCTCPITRRFCEHQIPLSIGGGIGQSRTLMLLLRKAHLGKSA